MPVDSRNLNKIQEMRLEYPQYADMSDDQFAQAIHGKYYPDIPYEEFSARAGVFDQGQYTEPMSKLAYGFQRTPPPIGAGDIHPSQLGIGPQPLEPGQGLDQGFLFKKKMPPDGKMWVDKKTGKPLPRDKWPDIPDLAAMEERDRQNLPFTSADPLAPALADGPQPGSNLYEHLGNRLDWMEKNNGLSPQHKAETKAIRKQIAEQVEGDREAFKRGEEYGEGPLKDWKWTYDYLTGKNPPMPTTIGAGQQLSPMEFIEQHPSYWLDMFSPVGDPRKAIDIVKGMIAEVKLKSRDGQDYEGREADEEAYWKMTAIYADEANQGPATQVMTGMGRLVGYMAAFGITNPLSKKAGEKTLEQLAKHPAIRKFLGRAGSKGVELIARAAARMPLFTGDTIREIGQQVVEHDTPEFTAEQVDNTIQENNGVLQEALDEDHEFVNEKGNLIINSDQPMWVSIFKGIGSEMIELISEETGEMIGEGLGRAIRGGKKASTRRGAKKIYDGLKKAWMGKTGGSGAQFRRTLKAVKFDGMINELGEEYLGKVGRSLAGIDDQGKPSPDGLNPAAEALFRLYRADPDIKEILTQAAIFAPLSVLGAGAKMSQSRRADRLLKTITGGNKAQLEDVRSVLQEMSKLEAGGIPRDQAAGLAVIKVLGPNQPGAVLGDTPTATPVVAGDTGTPGDVQATQIPVQGPAAEPSPVVSADTPRTVLEQEIESIQRGAGEQRDPESGRIIQESRPFTQAERDRLHALRQARQRAPAVTEERDAIDVLTGEPSPSGEIVTPFADRTAEELDDLQATHEAADDPRRDRILAEINAERVRRAGQVAKREMKVERMGPQVLADRREALREKTQPTPSEARELELIENRMRRMGSLEGEPEAPSAGSVESAVIPGEGRRDAVKRMRGLSDNDLIAQARTLSQLNETNPTSEVRRNLGLIGEEFQKRGIDNAEAEPTRQITGQPRQGATTAGPAILDVIAKRQARKLPIARIADVPLELVPPAHREILRVMKNIPGLRDTLIYYDPNPNTEFDSGNLDFRNHISQAERDYYAKHPEETPVPAGETAYDATAQQWAIIIYPAGQASTSVLVHELSHVIVGTLRATRPDLANAIDFWARQLDTGSEHRPGYSGYLSREEDLTDTVAGIALGETPKVAPPEEVLTAIEALWNDASMTPAQIRALEANENHLGWAEDNNVDPYQDSGREAPEDYTGHTTVKYKTLPKSQQKIAKKLGVSKTPPRPITQGFLHGDGSYSKIPGDSWHEDAARRAGTSLTDYILSGGIRLGLIQRGSETVILLDTSKPIKGPQAKTLAKILDQNHIFKAEWSYVTIDGPPTEGPAFLRGATGSQNVDSINATIERAKRNGPGMNLTVRHFRFARRETDIGQRFFLKTLDDITRTQRLANNAQALTAQLDKREAAAAGDKKALKQIKKERMRLKEAVKFALPKTAGEWIGLLKAYRGGAEFGNYKQAELDATGLVGLIQALGETKTEQAKPEDVDPPMRDRIRDARQRLDEATASGDEKRTIQASLRLKDIQAKARPNKAALKITAPEIADLIKSSRVVIKIQQMPEPWRVMERTHSSGFEPSYGPFDRNYHDYSLSGGHYFSDTIHYTPPIADLRPAQEALERARKARADAVNLRDEFNTRMQEKYASEEPEPKPEDFGVGTEAASEAEHYQNTPAPDRLFNPHNMNNEEYGVVAGEVPMQIEGEGGEGQWDASFYEIPVPEAIANYSERTKGVRLVIFDGDPRESNRWVWGWYYGPDATEAGLAEMNVEGMPRSRQEFFDIYQKLRSKAQAWVEEGGDGGDLGQAREGRLNERVEEEEESAKQSFTEEFRSDWERANEDFDIDFDYDWAEQAWRDHGYDSWRNGLEEEVANEVTEDNVERTVEQYKDAEDPAEVKQLRLRGFDSLWRRTEAIENIKLQMYRRLRNQAFGSHDTNNRDSDYRYRQAHRRWERERDNADAWRNRSDADPADVSKYHDMTTALNNLGDAEDRAAQDVSNLEQGQVYLPPHWSDMDSHGDLTRKNMIGHVRGTIYLGSEATVTNSGNIYAFIHELQSDMLQDIRWRGVQGDPWPEIVPEDFYLTDPWIKTTDSGDGRVQIGRTVQIVGPHDADYRKLVGIKSFDRTGSEDEGYVEMQELLWDAYRSALKRRADLIRRASRQTPWRPPWSDTKMITELMLKTAIHGAIDRGATHLSLTPGQVQPSRNSNNPEQAAGSVIEYDRRIRNMLIKVFGKWGVKAEVVPAGKILPKGEASMRGAQEVGGGPSEGASSFNRWKSGYAIANGRWSIKIGNRYVPGYDVAVFPIFDRSIPQVAARIKQFEQDARTTGEAIRPSFSRKHWPVWGVFHQEDAQRLGAIREQQQQGVGGGAMAFRSATELDRALANAPFWDVNEKTAGEWLTLFQQSFPRDARFLGLTNYLKKQDNTRPIHRSELAEVATIRATPVKEGKLITYFLSTGEATRESMSDYDRATEDSAWSKSQEWIQDRAVTPPIWTWKITDKVKQAHRRTGMFKMVPHEVDRQRLKVDTEEREVLAKPVSARGVIRGIKKEFPEVTFRGMATHKPRKALAWYDTKNTGIRMGDVSSITSATHEVAHHIDLGLQHYASLAPDNPAMKRELTQLGKWLYGKTRPNSGYAAEGWAEFLRMYLTNEDTQKEVPATHEWFTKHYLRGHQDMANKLGRIKRLITGFQAQGAINRGKGMINRKPLRGTLREQWDRLRLWVATNFRDEYAPLKAEMKKAKLWGRLPEHRDPYQLAVFFASKAAAKAREFVLTGTTDLWGNPNGIGLAESLAPLRGDPKLVNDFTVYAIHKRAQHLFTRGIESGPSQKDADYIVTHFENIHPEFKGVLKEVTDWNHRLLDYLVEAGGMAPEVAGIIKASNPVYVPFFRAFEPGELKQIRQNTGRGMQTPRTPVKRIAGSRREIIDPIESMIAQAQRIIGIAQKAAVSKALMDLQAYPHMAGFMWEVPAPKKATQFKAQQIMPTIRRLLEEKFGIDADQMAEAKLAEWGDDVLTIYTNAIQYFGKDNIIPLAHNGKIRWFETSPEVYKMLMGLDAPVLPAFLNLTLGKLARGIRLGATGLNPSFGLIRNLIRDVATFTGLAKYAKGGPLSAFGGIVQDVARTPHAQKFKALGGKMAGQIGRDRSATQHLRGEAMASTVGRKVIHHAVHPIQVIRELFGVSEAGTRIGEFSAALNQLEKKYGKDSPRATVAGFNAGQDVTTNFTRHGAIAKYLNGIIPFFNAAIQGPDKLLRSLRERPVQTVMRGIAMLSVLAVYLWHKNRDKEWYKNLETYERTNYIHIEQDEDNIWRLPLPFEFGHIFAALPVAALDAHYRDNPKLFNDVIGEVLDRANPFGHRSLIGGVAGFGTAMQIMRNEDWAGRPIIPRRFAFKPVPPEDEYTPYTTEICKYVGKVLKISPIQLEYAINGVSGGLYRRTIRGAEKVSGRTEFKTGPSDLPVVGTLFTREPYAPRRQMREFFDRKDTLERINNADRASDKEKKELFRYKKIYDLLIPHLRTMTHLKTKDARKERFGYISDQLERFAEGEKERTGKRPW